MTREQEQAMAHDIIAHFFDRPVRDMGGGMKIIELPRKWMDVRWADMIRRILKAYADNLSYPDQPSPSLSSPTKDELMAMHDRTMTMLRNGDV